MYIKMIKYSIIFFMLLFFAGVTFFVIFDKTQCSSYLEQIGFLQEKKFLNEEGKAIFDYTRAAKLLRKKGISTDFIKKAMKASSDEIEFDKEIYNADILDIIFQGARRIHLGLPKSSHTLFWENSYAIDGEMLNIDDLYLCVDYICYLLKHEIQPSDSCAHADVAYSSIAMGIQMAQYRDQVLRAYSFASQYYALKWLINHHKDQQDLHDQYKNFLQVVEIEYEKFKQEPIRWPVFIEVSIFIYQYRFVWLLIAGMLITFIIFRRHRYTKQGSKMVFDKNNDARKIEK